MGGAGGCCQQTRISELCSGNKCVHDLPKVDTVTGKKGTICERHVNTAPGSKYVQGESRLTSVSSSGATPSRGGIPGSIVATHQYQTALEWNHTHCASTRQPTLQYHT
eukprot:1889187-Rhodomonas_salina.2